MKKSDIIPTIQQKPKLWDHFTRKEEYNPSLTDQYERFPYYLSTYRDIFEPSVSRHLIQSGYKPEYPDGKKFAVCLTHDIDGVYRSFFSKGYHIARSVYSRNFSEIKKNLRYLFNKKYSYYNFNVIMDLEERYGATSSFYFLALVPGDQDYSYDIADLQDTLHSIRDRGWEVGLHGGHEAYDSYETICTEKKRLESVLGSPVTGYRNHYLHFRVPNTWEHLAKAGFLYDATFGYADCAGFRNGMCHPFRPYNLKTDQEINIIELPLIVMDCTLFAAYMRLDAPAAWTLIQRLIDTVADLRGVFTLLWHNTYLIEDSSELKLYEKILAYCQERGAWMTSGDEIINWWITNNE